MNSIVIRGRKYTEMCFARGVDVLSEEDVEKMSDDELTELIAQLEAFRFTETFHPDIKPKDIRLDWPDDFTDGGCLYVVAEWSPKIKEV